MDVATGRGDGRHGVDGHPAGSILLDETNHRVANEVAAALAAMRLSLGRPGRAPSSALIRRAIERLEGFGEAVKLLSAPMERTVDLGDLMTRLCRALLRARPDEAEARLVLDVQKLEVNRTVARTMMTVANELVTNALKYAMTGAGTLKVRLERLGGDLVLSVVDCGPGLGAGESSLTSGTRLGGRIVGELVGSAGGWIDCDTGPGGTSIHVVLPMTRRSGRIPSEL